MKEVRNECGHLSGSTFTSRVELPLAIVGSSDGYYIYFSFFRRGSSGGLKERAPKEYPLQVNSSMLCFTVSKATGMARHR